MLISGIKRCRLQLANKLSKCLVVYLKDGVLMKLLVEVNIHEGLDSLHVLSPLQDILASEIELSKEQLLHIPL